ncbi:peptidoglycan-binding protein [Streptomyces sp. NBC_00322]|uniref:peptidoglycan-binding domain-containing protein n=1 Tax=Streptomyces sp. NBC_00322 TaxID=2975712 RepID=UPI002E27F9E5|nr:peptidoglycan-binding domain-containing protein [Streptomyces sp. NBC_00322]
MQILKWIGQRKALATGTALAATVLAAGLLSPTAQASSTQGYVAGSGSVLDDFGDEGTLRRGGTYANSGATGLWQSILYADGFLSVSDIDCQFGPTTEAATKRWQQTYGLTADGVVGPATFGRADVSLYDEGYSGTTLNVKYGGSKRPVYFQRTSQSKYLFRTDPSSSVYYMLTAYYTSTPYGC